MVGVNQLLTLPKNGRALYWNLSSFKKEREVGYEGEGWGLCFDGRRLVMSDGSDHLFFRDPDSFAKIGDVAVRRAGMPVRNLNELECGDGVNRILRIGAD